MTSIQAIHNENFVSRNGNVISVTGSFSPAQLPYFLSALHGGIDKAGYEELILDFTKCTVAFSSNMLAVCSQIIERREAGAYTKLELPEYERLAKLFYNTNWANFIDPRRYEQGNKNIYSTNIPATRYSTPKEQHQIVNRVINVLLGIVPDMERSDFEAFEWSVNEITDNVLTHSESKVGGLIQLTVMKKKNAVEFTVADAGMGIPASLRSGQYPHINDVDALDKAIREGITRDPQIGQGNGLFGSYQISSHSKGSYQIRSGHACLTHSNKAGLRVRNDKIPYNGTLVVAEVNFSEPGLLGEALQFSGKKYTPTTSYVEAEYNRTEDGQLVFKLIDEADSFGTRPAGTPVRNKLLNLCKMYKGETIIVDFDGVPLMSSSFADEVFGKLYIELGPIDFMKKMAFVNILPTSEGLINKAITQRMKLQ